MDAYMHVCVLCYVHYCTSVLPLCTIICCIICLCSDIMGLIIDKGGVAPDNHTVHNMHLHFIVEKYTRAYQTKTFQNSFDRLSYI